MNSCLYWFILYTPTHSLEGHDPVVMNTVTLYGGIIGGEKDTRQRASEFKDGRIREGFR